MEQFPLIIFLIFFILLIFFSLLLLKKNSKENREKKKNLPPCPWKLPIIGNLHQIGLMPHKSFLRLSRKHGPIMLLHLGRIPTLVISSNKALESIFKSHDIIFSGRPALKAVTKFSFNNSNISFARYGEKWRQARKICVRELLSARRVRAFKTIREEEMVKLFREINDRSCSNSALVNLSEMVFALSYNVLCRAVFGGVRSGFRGVMAETQSLAARFCVADFFPGWGWIDGIVGYWEKVEKNFGELNRFIEMVIEEHLNKGEEKENDDEEDLVDVLLRLHKEAADGAFLSTVNDVKGIMAGNGFSSFSVLSVSFCLILMVLTIGRFMFMMHNQI